VFPCSSSAHRAPGKKAAAPIYNALVRPGRESNSRPHNSLAKECVTRQKAKRGPAITRGSIIINQGERRLKGQHANKITQRFCERCIIECAALINMSFNAWPWLTWWYNFWLSKQFRFDIAVLRPNSNPKAKLYNEFSGFFISQ